MSETELYVDAHQPIVSLHAKTLFALPWRSQGNWERCSDCNDNLIIPWPFSLSLYKYIYIPFRLTSGFTSDSFLRTFLFPQTVSQVAAVTSGGCFAEKPVGFKNKEEREDGPDPISRLIKELFRVYPYFDRNRKQTSSSVVPSSFETLRGDFIRCLFFFPLFLFSVLSSTLVVLLRCQQASCWKMIFGLIIDTRSIAKDNDADKRRNKTGKSSRLIRHCYWSYAA